MGNPSHILLVDDDVELSDMVAELFARESWQTHCAHTGEAGEQALKALRPQVVVLDVMLPDANGYELCRRWRTSHPALGLLMLTARGDPLDRVLGLEIGADDYLAKPFHARELVARTRALLRRTEVKRDEVSELRFDGLVIDLLRREVRMQGQTLALTSIEFKLLLALVRSPGRPLSREALSEAVQNGAYRPLDRTVDVQVARLRRKLAEASDGQGAAQEWIDTVRGEGYVFVPRG